MVNSYKFFKLLNLFKCSIEFNLFSLLYTIFYRDYFNNIYYDNPKVKWVKVYIDPIL